MKTTKSKPILSGTVQEPPGPKGTSIELAITTMRDVRVLLMLADDALAKHDGATHDQHMTRALSLLNATLDGPEPDERNRRQIEAKPFGVLMGEAMPPNAKMKRGHLRHTETVGDWTVEKMGTQEHGVVAIYAVNSFITNDRGDQIKREYEKTKFELVERYGVPSSVYDFVDFGSKWKDGSFWTMSLLKEDRVLSAFWLGPATSHITNVCAISVEADAFKPDVGCVIVIYQSELYKEYKSGKSKRKREEPPPTPPPV